MIYVFKCDPYAENWTLVSIVGMWTVIVQFPDRISMFSFVYR